MPRKPKRPCSYPGCPNLTEGQYCKEHEAAARRQYNKYERSADVNKKYGRAWKRIRDRYAAAHPLCEMCLKEGRLTPVDEVHHIVPISQGGTHARDNLMSLCRSCHTKIHHDIGDRYLWQPSLTAGTPDTILGRPVRTSAYMPAIAASAKTIAFGDFSYYWIADRQGRSFKRLNELYAANGQVGFLASQRVDGKLILSEAIKVLAQKAST